MKKCYLFGAAPLDRINISITSDTIIAADGGYDTLMAHGILPSALVGDMDSIESELPSGIDLIRFPTRKDETDMHLCYLEGKRRGCDTFVIFGGVGGRTDHTLSNISLLLFAKERGDNAYLVGNGEIFFAVKDESVKFTLPKGRGISVFAASENCRMWVRGLEYECEDLSLTMDMPIGVSNSSLGKEGEIKVCGRAIVMVASDEKEFVDLIDKR